MTYSARCLTKYYPSLIPKAPLLPSFLKPNFFEKKIFVPGRLIDWGYMHNV